MKKLLGYFKNRNGMSLVELLTAMTILMLVIFCFAPLYMTYFNTIRISGENLQKTYQKAGLMQTLIGNKGTDENSGYESNVSEIPLIINAPETTVTENGITQIISGTSIAVGTRANESGYIDPIKGSFIFTNPDDKKNSFSTIYTNSLNSNINCFPSSLTDDFKTATLTVVANGFNFVDNNMKSDTYSLYCTVANDSNTGSRLKRLTFGKDYTIKRVSGTNHMLTITLYGGTDVSFENSPLVFDYNGGSYVKEIEIDAPMMLMVGEANTDGDYYYYVSRGEVDDNGNLVVLRREMKSKDPKNGNAVTTLNAGMNDVEWVPADSGDGYNVDKNGNAYGYYVMCGDNGQIRRFWRNNATGNYYWGGDYTYYTDYNFNRFRTPTYIYSTDKNGTPNSSQVYSTDTSFKFISQRSMTEKQHGFNVGSKEYLVAGVANTATGLLRGLSVVSVTYSEDAEFYATDGKIYYYQSKGEDGTMPSANQMSGLYSGGSSFNGHDILTTKNISPITHDAYGWMTANTGSYYEVNGIDKSTINEASYPITLTSVDAIRITGTGASHKTDVTNDGSYYFTTTGKGDTSAEGAVTNMNYPQSSYNLYCGYIPAMMDLFGEVTGLTGSYKYPIGWKGNFAQTSDGTFYDISASSNIGRADNRRTLDDNTTYYTKWRMTLGVTPYYNDGASTVKKDDNAAGVLAYYKKNKTSGIGKWGYPYEYVVYYPYTNLEYAITGKFFDEETYVENYDDIKSSLNLANNVTVANPSQLVINTYDNRQTHLTNGKVVDITIAYLSHPFALAVAANPTDDVVYDYGNNKDWGQIFFWNNRRETITFLDCASTVIPNGDQDIPVSLMVGYLLGGVVEYSSAANSFYANVGSVMNNGIVFLRAGNYDVKTQNSDNGETYEYQATDKDGYKLAAESNVFHQFYYLNSRNQEGASTKPELYGSGGVYSGQEPQDPKKGRHIGNLFGALYWQNNRHIQYLSIYCDDPVGEPGADDSNNYEYLRSHPLANTKVNCVAWGTTWNGNPEAMWGTENGTVLSWWVDLQKVKDAKADFWNDKSVAAEFQSYFWIDNCNNRTFAAITSEWKGTVGSAKSGSGSLTGASFTPGSERFAYFYDQGTQRNKLYSSIGFVSTLDTINDICYANDLWVAVGDQSDRDPADYCPGGKTTFGSKELGTELQAKAFSDDGRNGSWVNVRYWLDVSATGVHAENNNFYHWRAVKISNKDNYNIVQINMVNGIWIATGYVDANNNGEYDEKEKTVVCWATDPLKSCSESANGGWTESTIFWSYEDGQLKNVTKEVGGINSVATRT